MGIYANFYITHPEEKEKENGFVLILKHGNSLSTHLSGYVPFGDEDKCKYWEGWLEFLGGIDTFDPKKKYYDYSSGEFYTRTIKPEIVAIPTSLFNWLEEEKQKKNQARGPILAPPSKKSNKKQKKKDKGTKQDDEMKLLDHLLETKERTRRKYYFDPNRADLCNHVYACREGEFEIRCDLEANCKCAHLENCEYGTRFCLYHVRPHPLGLGAFCHACIWDKASMIKTKGTTTSQQESNLDIWWLIERDYVMDASGNLPEMDLEFLLKSRADEVIAALKHMPLRQYMYQTEEEKKIFYQVIFYVFNEDLMGDSPHYLEIFVVY